MSTTLKTWLRRWLVVLASAAGLLAWTAAAAAAPDSGEGPGPKAPPASQPAVFVWPDKWEKADDLLAAAVEMNSEIAQNERTELLPWGLADQIRRSLAAGRPLIDKVPAESRPAYFQPLFVAALAAGYPDQAMAAARELVQLDPKVGWNWQSVYRAAMAQGNKAACTEAIDKLREILKKDEGLEPMRNDAEPIGLIPGCELTLSDNTTLNPAKCGKVLVVDFWMFAAEASKKATVYNAHVFKLFKNYAQFRMVSVDMDIRDYKVLALSYMKANGMDWPTCFEGQADRPISGKIFHIHQIPAEVVVGADGTVIFCGTPDRPEFVYAIRSGLVKANKGTIPSSQPDRPAKVAGPGVNPTPPGTGAGPAHNGPARKDPAAVAAEKTRQEQVGAEQLKLAEAFLAADSRDNAIRVYQELIKNYPDTTAAMKARIQLMKLAP